jgi:hypothetical protein
MRERVVAGDKREVGPRVGLMEGDQRWESEIPVLVMFGSVNVMNELMLSTMHEHPEELAWSIVEMRSATRTENGIKRCL